MKKIPLSSLVNGEPVETLVAPTSTLLDWLRDGLGLTGAKEGCGNGNCGACTVLLDGRPVLSCLVLAAEAADREIVTVEGLATRAGYCGSLSAVQSAFVNEGGLQCGFCTPGFVVATTALLEKNPQPTEHEIRLGLSNNLCRCTGYDKIVAAVQAVASKGLGRGE